MSRSIFIALTSLFQHKNSFKRLTLAACVSVTFCSYSSLAKDTYQQGYQQDEPGEQAKRDWEAENPDPYVPVHIRDAEEGVRPLETSNFKASKDDIYVSTRPIPMYRSGRSSEEGWRVRDLPAGTTLHIPDLEKGAANGWITFKAKSKSGEVTEFSLEPGSIKDLEPSDKYQDGYKVLGLKFVRENNDSDEVWVPKINIRKDKKGAKAIWQSGIPSEPVDDDCKCDRGTQPTFEKQTKKLQNAARKHSTRYNAINTETKSEIESRKLADQIADKMGQCLLPKGTHGKLTDDNIVVPADLRKINAKIKAKKGNIANLMAEKKRLTRERNKNTMDQYVKPHWDKQNGLAGLNTKDLLAIDNLARTIYGEMAKCDNKYNDNRYSTAVAATINNRQLALEHKVPRSSRFKRTGASHHHPNTQIVSAKYQYNVWDRGDPNLPKILCPPSNFPGKYWENERQKPITANVQKIWRNALNLAVEIHKYPKGLRARTKSKKNLKGIDDYFYTSKTNWQDALCNNPKLKKEQKEKCEADVFEYERPRYVNDLPLDDAGCLRLWGDKPLKNLKQKGI